MSSTQKKIANLKAKISLINEERNQLIELLSTACKYCNNLENYLKDKGHNRIEIENIKKSIIKK